MNISREPARWVSLGAAILAALVVQGILTTAEMEAYLRIVVAVVMIVLGGGAGEVIREKVIPVSKEDSRYVPLPPDRKDFRDRG